MEFFYYNSRHEPVCVPPFKAMYGHGPWPIDSMDLELNK